MNKPDQTGPDVSAVPHYRGVVAVGAGRAFTTYLDRGSRRFLAVPMRAARRILAAAVFIYGAGTDYRVTLEQDGQSFDFLQLFVLTGFPYLSFSRKARGAYKSLNVRLGFQRLDDASKVVITGGAIATGGYDVAKIAPVCGADLTDDLDGLSSRIETMGQNGERMVDATLAAADLSLHQLGQHPASEMAAQKARIALWCNHLVNHRTAHKLLKDWSGKAGRDEARAFQENLAKVTYPLALGRHGYNPSFANLDLAVIEAELAALIGDLKKMDVTPFINSGTLLGYFRDGRPIIHDDDFDLGILLNGETEDEIFARWARFVAAVQALRPTTDKGSFLSVRLGNDVQVDLFAAWILEKQLYVFPYCYGDCPADALIPPQDLSVRDVTFPIPADPDQVLAVNYGPNWRTPDPFWRFDYAKSKRRFGRVMRALKAQRLP